MKIVKINWTMVAVIIMVLIWMEGFISRNKQVILELINSSYNSIGESISQISLSDNLFFVGLVAISMPMLWNLLEMRKRVDEVKNITVDNLKSLVHSVKALSNNEEVNRMTDLTLLNLLITKGIITKEEFSERLKYEFKESRDRKNLKEGEK